MERHCWTVRHVLFALLLALAAPGCFGDDPPAGLDAGLDAAPRAEAGGDGADAAPGKHRQQVDDLVSPIMAGKWTVGLVVGLTSPDSEEVYTYGETKAGGGVKPDRDTLFEIGSITKTFTSLALAGLVADGKLKLDDEVKTLLPAGKVTMPARNGKEITLLQLSTHTSGLPRLPGNFNPKDPEKPYVDYTATQLYSFLSGYTLPREPGAQWEYSNLAVGLLGHALTLKAGQTYAALLADRITTPLKLKDTVMALSPEQSKRFAQGHNWDLAATSSWEFDVLAPAGALRSSARDMLAYAAAQAGITTSPLSPTMAATHTSRYLGAKIEMGLGWVISPAGYLWHNGGTYGFETFIAFDKQARVGVVVLGNAQSVYGPQTKLGTALIKMMTKQSYQPVSLPATIEVPTATLDHYVGTYSTTTFKVTIKRTGADLYATWTGQPDHRLYAQTSESFYLRADVIAITFIKDSAGAYSSLTFATSTAKSTLTRTP